jgi:hypothetical protein
MNDAAAKKDDVVMAPWKKAMGHALHVAVGAACAVGPLSPW